MQSQMLLSNKTSTNPGSQVLIEEASDLDWIDIFATLKEASCQCGNGIGMGLN